MTLLMLALSAPLLAQDAGERPVVEDAAPQVLRRKVWLDEDLFVQSDIMLQGIHAVETVDFSLPQGWGLVTDPILYLRLEHSAALQSSRSSLSVQVNGKIIYSVRLDASNIVGGEIPVPIPRALLSNFNDLKLMVVQHITDACEDPFDPALWTRVRADSFIEFSYHPLTLRPDLSRFPFPLFDEQGYGPLTMALGGVGQASSGQLAALAELGFALGRLADYRGVSLVEPVDALAETDAHVLVVGTPSENPMVGALLGSAPPGPGEGMVAIRPDPAHPERAVLIVTGGDEAGLLAAAQALAGNDRYELLAGSQATIRSVEASAPPATRQLPLPLPEGDDFTLLDLSISDQTVRGFYAPPVTIPLKLDGDDQIQINGARVGIDYAYSALLDNSLSTMEVRLNGVTLRSVALDEYNGEEKRRLWVELPYELMEPTSDLQVVFHLFPKDFNPCEYVSDKQIWATIFETTTFEMARDHFTDLPDLSLLRHRLWPLNQAVGEDGVVILTDAAPSAEDASAAMMVAALLGQHSTTDRPKLAITAAGQGVLSAVAGADLVVLSGAGSNPAVDALIADRKLTTVGSLERRVQQPGADLLSAQVSADWPIIEQALISSEHTALVLRAPDDAGLRPLVNRLTDASTLYKLEGSAVALGAGGVVQPLEVAKTHRVGFVPPLRRMQLFIRNSWFLLGGLLLLAGFVLAVVIRTWGTRRGGQV